MSDKAEISWHRPDDDGERWYVYARHFAGQWKFFRRRRRYDQWVEDPEPELVDWLELLDAVRRRIPRRLVRPEEEGKVIREIRRRHPAADIPS